MNTYAVFAELNRTLIAASGRLGCIVPTGIATDDTTKYFFQDLLSTRALVSLFDFQTGPGLFAEIGHARFKFCLLTLTGAARPCAAGAAVAFFLRAVSELDESGRTFVLTAEDVLLLNPNTRTCPVFRTRRDADLVRAVYRRVPVLLREATPERTEQNPWGISFARMFDMTNDSGLFRTRDRLVADGYVPDGNIFQRGSERWLPLYEAKLVHHFNHRFGDYIDKPSGSESTALPEIPASRLQDPSYSVTTRYWVSQVDVVRFCSQQNMSGWFIGWRDICRSTDFRTVIASVVPLVGVGNSLPVSVLAARVNAASFVACVSSFVFDYVARFKVGGTHLNFFIAYQLPVLPPTTYEQACGWDPGRAASRWLRSRVLELTYTAWDLEPFANDCGYNGPPFRWDEQRRFLLRCELDAAFFHLYGIARDDVDYIMETFPIVKRKDIAAHGDYRTKLTILDIYDRMQRAIDTGEPYKTLLYPPPADPRVAHPPRS